MDKENKQEQTSFQDVEQDDATNLQENHAGQMDEMSDSDKLSGDSDELTEENWKLKYDELNDMHLRLFVMAGNQFLLLCCLSLTTSNVRLTQ